MFFLSAALLFCSLALSQSAPVPCHDLLRQSDRVDVGFLLGKWVLIAGSLSSHAHKERFQSRDTANVIFANETDGLSIYRHFGFGENCTQFNSNVTLNGSIIAFDNFNSTLTLLHSSCTDCFVASSRYPHDRQRLYLFSRGREVEQEHFEEFTAQSQCLDLLPPVMMNSTKKLCPLSE